MRRIVLLTLLVSATAIAGPDPKAAAHYKQGKAFLDSKQFDQAILEFEAAYAIDKVPSHLYNIAKAYEAKGDYDKAIEYYQKYLEADPATKLAAEVRGAIASATQARDAARAKKEADERAAQVAAKKRDAAGHVKQAEAFAQAGAWGDAGNEYKLAFAIDDDPDHLLAAAEAYRKAPDLKSARDAYAAYLDKVPQGDVSDATRGKLAEVTKAIESQQADIRVKEKTTDGRTEPPPSQPAVEYDTSARDKRHGIALRIGIPGAIVTVAGVGLGLKALSDSKDAKNNECDRALVCTESGASKLDSAHSKARIADVMLGLGLAATVTGVVLWVKAPSPVEKAKLAPTVSPTGAGVSLIGSF